MEEKHECFICKKQLNIAEFYKRKNGKPFPYCKECSSRKQKEYRIKNPRYWENSLKKRHEHWDEYLKSVKEYRSTSGGWYWYLKGRAKEKVLFSKEEFIEWDKNQKRKCFYCGVTEEETKKNPFFKFTSGKQLNRLTLDRKNSELPYQLDNIVLSCWVCNKVKSNIFNSEEFKKIAKEYITPKWQI
jgi:hypothetical protein